jgi:HD-GYP domain-containing protein (c-di-GMP phosphodiesterase class II)
MGFYLKGMRMHFEISYLCRAGINNQRAEFAKNFCINALEELTKEASVAKAFQVINSHREAREHVFSVAFFTVLIASKINWTSKRILKILAQSALLHELWLCAKDKEAELANFRITADSEEYLNHPTATVAEVKKRTEVEEAVIQVLFQHHELNDGTGGPSQLTKSSIYPLAKILCLAEGFVSFIEQVGKEPHSELKSFFHSVKVLEKYDHDSLKSLIQCFIKEDDATVTKEILKYA